MVQRAQPPQKVAFVLGQCGPGGTEEQSRLLVRGLLQRGVDVDVFVVEGGHGRQPLAEADFGGAPVSTLTAHRGAGFADPFTLCLAGVRLGTALRRRRYDVVHAALARAYVVAPIIAPWRHRPRIVSWRRNLGVHLRQRRAATAVDRMAAHLSDVIVANSESVRDFWVTHARVPVARTWVIPNALEGWRFHRVPAQPGNPAIVRLVTVGGLRPVKGHSVLIDAAAALLARSIPVEVVILGEGASRGELCEQADRLGVPLVLPGHTPDTRAWLGSATVYVHPSLSEGASNAVAEAMAQGCAILATDVGGTAEMLGPAGVLVPSGRAEVLAADVEALCADPQRRHDLGGQARERARTLFDLDRVVDRHLDCYMGA